jgi:hypothetical protein
VAYKYNVWALKDRFRDHQPMVAYWSQLKAWNQLSIELLQEFAVANEQLAYRVLLGLPNNFIYREAAYALTNAVKDWDLKQRLINEALKY